MKRITFLSLISLTITGLAAPAYGASVFISPPPTLILDSVNINEGVFTVNSASSFTNNGGFIDETPITGLPNSIDAVIGESSKQNFLFNAPDDAQALRITGNFDASDPNLSPASFDIFIDAEGTDIISSLDNYIYFLPRSTSNFAYQITQLGTSNGLNDNVDEFSSTLPIAESDGNGGIMFIGTTPVPQIQFVDHGTSQPTPEPTTILGLIAFGGLGLYLKRNKQS